MVRLTSPLICGGAIRNDDLRSDSMNKARNITDACHNAIKLAKKLNARVQFTFNGIELFVTGDSDSIDLQNEYRAKYEELNQVRI